MVDLNPAPALFLRESELRQGIELLYFGYRDLTARADALLADSGFGRAHHRALYFIARRPGLTVTDLLRTLKITKQSLARVLSDLQTAGFVLQKVGPVDRRQRLLHLTEAGAKLERDLLEALKEPMRQAYSNAGPQAVAGFWQVLMALIDETDQAAIQHLASVSAARR
jgi:DNA-binding MarR family transcriptional regulator